MNAKFTEISAAADYIGPGAIEVPLYQAVGSPWSTYVINGLRGAERTFWSPFGTQFGEVFGEVLRRDNPSAYARRVVT
jgi:hypothetical protein